MKKNNPAKIYTKTGDTGKTVLIGGKRVPKNHPIIEALGSIDELNAVLGTIDYPLEDIQKDLQTLSSKIAGYKSTKSLKVYKLEREIDRMQKKLPKLKSFIIPKGQVHVARAICRRAERRVVAIDMDARYLNRLSDYLFVLARWITTH